MKCSYGVKTNIPFDKRRHDVKQKVLKDGEEKCDNIAFNLNLSLNIVILSTYDDESMADCKLFPPKSLHFPSIATNGIVTLTFFFFSLPTVRFTASNSRTRSK
jgi:hypothetical protein